MDEVKRFVGIDVAKVALELFIGPAGAAFSVACSTSTIPADQRQLFLPVVAKLIAPSILSPTTSP